MSATHLLDTSAIIAIERGTPLGELHAFERVIATMTLAELNVGLLRSPTAAVTSSDFGPFRKPAVAHRGTLMRPLHAPTPSCGCGRVRSECARA